MKIKKNNRGFKFLEFKDKYDHKCSLQKSSLATEDCIWLGVSDPQPMIMDRDAVRLGLPRGKKSSEEIAGWVPYEIPKEVHISTRMHLTRGQVKKLLPILQCFVTTGELNNE